PLARGHKRAGCAKTGTSKSFQWATHFNAHSHTAGASYAYVRFVRVSMGYSLQRPLAPWTEVSGNSETPSPSFNGLLTSTPTRTLPALTMRRSSKGSFNG